MSFFKIDESKSYATEANLMKALVKYGLDKENPLVVRNKEGRWTAVFHIMWSSAKEGGYIGFASQYGFLTFN